MKTNEPSLNETLPLSLQHLLAMFVGAIVPPLLLANVINAPSEVVTNFIQAALFSSAIATFIQIFPIKIFGKYKTGSALPLMMGMNYVFLGVSLSVVGKYGIASLFGGLLISSIISIFLSKFIVDLKKFFTPLVSGVLIICLGIGLFQPAVHNLAGGLGNPSYGDPFNFFLGTTVAIIIIFLNKFATGTIKNSAILIGILVGYAIALVMGKIDFSQVGNAQWFSLPTPVAYGMEFNPEVIFIFIIAYAISIIDFMGCCTIITMGGLNRDLETEEYQNGAIGNGIGSVFSALIGAIPVTGLSQNAIIVSLNKKTNRIIFTLAASFLLLASISPKIGAVLVTIPNAVIGGATVIMFGMIVMAGITVFTFTGLTDEAKLIAGFSIAISIGLSNIPGILSKFPEIIQVLVGGSSIIPAVVMALFLQAVFSLLAVKSDTNAKEAGIQDSLIEESLIEEE